MNNIKKQQHNRQSDHKTSQSSLKRKIEKPPIFPDLPIPNEPTKPARTEENPDPTRLEPGVNDPTKNDPSRIDEEPPIFNNFF